MRHAEPLANVMRAAQDFIRNLFARSAIHAPLHAWRRQRFLPI